MHSRLKCPSGVVARRSVAAVGVGLAVSAGTALADDAGPTVSQVVVTAQDQAPQQALSKLPAKLADIPQSITVLTQPLLQSQGAISLPDALRNVPGVTIAAAEGGTIGNNINLNGFSARTDIFLDGFRDRGQYYRDIFSLQEVEVLMGPSSMLFGRGSTGGAINQVSKRPTLQGGEEFTLSGTSNGLVRGTADVDAAVSSDAALRLAAMAQSGAVSTRLGTTVQDYGFAPSYQVGIGTPTVVTLSALIQHNHDRPDYGVPPLNGVPAKSGFDTIYGYSTDHTNQDMVTASGEVKHTFNAQLSIRDQVQYNSVTVDAIETAPHGIGTVGPGGYTALNPAGISNLPLSELYVQLQSHDRLIHDTALYNQLELNARFATGPVRHELVAGTEVGRDTYDNQAYTRTGTCNGVSMGSGYVGCEPLLNPPYTASPTELETPGDLAAGKDFAAAAYVNDTMTVTPQLKLVGGVRYDYFDASISNSINSANTPGNTSFPSLHQAVGFTSVRGGPIWQPTPAQSYYFSYSTSFNPALQYLTSSTGLSQPLPPEINVAYEVGGKWTLHGLDLTAALFQITQYNSYSQNPDNTYTANGDIRVRGGRLGAAGYITPKWQVQAGYTYLGAKIVKAVAAGTLGMVPSNTPASSASVWTTYDFSSVWQAGGGATYVGQRFANNTDQVSVPGYTRLDATLAWRQPRYEVRLNLFNLANAHYYDAIIQSDGGRAVPGSGRTAMLTFTWRP